MADQRIEDVLRHLHPPPGAKPWHGGPTVLGALRGVSSVVASWRPYPERHSIWGLALHVAYWNYAVERRLTDGERGHFPRRPSNWPRVPQSSDEATWSVDRRLVREHHDRLVEAVAAFDVSRLDEVQGSSKTTYADLISGILLHDTYHAGQIQMLKRLATSQGL